MSHVVRMQVKIYDLTALRQAAAECGLEFLEGQRTYRWFGEFVGDYSGSDAANRHGMRPEDYGRNAAHVLSLPGKHQAYQVGVIAEPDGSYTLAWDTWKGGYGLSQQIGQDGAKLQQAYGKHAAINAVTAAGHTLLEQRQLADGRVQLVVGVL